MVFSSFRFSLILIPLLSLWGSRGISQSCFPEGITFSTQAQIDAFAADYPDCTQILGDVTIEEAEAGEITNLRGLARITTFGDYLEIHDNTALNNLSGLENVHTIEGGLNIFGNPGLQDLKGLEGLTHIKASMRIALNHELRSIAQLSALQSVLEDLTIADNRLLPSLHGLESLDTIGGYLIIINSGALLELQGLSGVRATGKGVLIENNPRLRDLRGLDGIKSVGGNLLIIDNSQLRTLEGLEALTVVDGKLQIALNPFLESVTSLKNLVQINGLLQIYANVGLRSLSGLENIDPDGIEDLAILDCDVLTTCHVKSICDFLGVSKNLASISMNGTGCNFRAQILERCRSRGPSVRPKQKEIVFFPNPTSGTVAIAAENIEQARFEVVDGPGRILLQGQLQDKTIDLSELAAGLYFVKIRTEELEIVRSIVKLN